MTTICLVDGGSGNLRSVQKALEHVGARVAVTSDPQALAAAEKLVLPGVGAFGDVMAGLRARGLDQAVRAQVAAGQPLLGICVGMQVLFEAGEEQGEHVGLGLLPGRVRRLSAPGLPLPHTGWNQLEPAQPDSPLLRGVPAGAYAYFNHGYGCVAAPANTLATTEYGESFASAVGRGRLYGIQCHPEKSQAVGLVLLRNFVEAG
jgi:glutamine amidotransferase